VISSEYVTERLLPRVSSYAILVTDFEVVTMNIVRQQQLSLLLALLLVRSYDPLGG
jgi:hypothetical protein